MLEIKNLAKSYDTRTIFKNMNLTVNDGEVLSIVGPSGNRWQTMRKIVLPQVVKIVMPSVGNEVVTLVKDTSLVYVIGLGDLMRAGNIAASRDVTLAPYLLVGLRGTPLLLQIVFVYYGLSLAHIVTFPRFEAAVITFIINYAAYFAEIFRGGLQSIPQGQYDGAKVLGLTAGNGVQGMDYMMQIMPSLLDGLKMTIGVFALTLIGSVPLGILVALALKSDIFLLRWVTNGYIWVMQTIGLDEPHP
ncbi:ABC transporter permease subunit [Weissella confusa]|uniref:ABC transporter permease subunit n=1 Tax=Weissella confusa TaxID=1583 RepID=A0A923NGT2_WEICO|nr:ABC transporter permease subunit [Weissella confusa]